MSFQLLDRLLKLGRDVNVNTKDYEVMDDHIPSPKKYKKDNSEEGKDKIIKTRSGIEGGTSPPPPPPQPSIRSLSKSGVWKSSEFKNAENNGNNEQIKTEQQQDKNNNTAESKQQNNTQNIQQQQNGPSRQVFTKKFRKAWDNIKNSIVEQESINFDLSPGFRNKENLIGEIRKLEYSHKNIVSVEDVINNIVPSFSNVLNILPKSLINLNYDRELMVKFYKNFTFPTIMKIIELSSENKIRLRYIGIEINKDDREKVKNSLIGLISSISSASEAEITSIVNDLFSPNKEKVIEAKDRLLTILTKDEESLSEFNVSILRILGNNPILVRRMIEGNIKNLESFSRQIDEIEDFLIKEYTAAERKTSLSGEEKSRRGVEDKRDDTSIGQTQESPTTLTKQDSSENKKENLFEKLKNFLYSDEVPILAKLAVIAGGGLMLFGLLDFGIKTLFRGGVGGGGMQYVQPAQQQQFPIGSLIVSLVGALMAWMGFSSYNKK